MNKIPQSSVAPVRAEILERVKARKAAIVAYLEGGYRDWAPLHKLVNEYAQAQDAADVLGGMTLIDKLPEARSPYDESKAP